VIQGKLEHDYGTAPGPPVSVLTSSMNRSILPRTPEKILLNGSIPSFELTVTLPFCRALIL